MRSKNAWYRATQRFKTVSSSSKRPGAVQPRSCILSTKEPCRRTCEQSRSAIVNERREARSKLINFSTCSEVRRSRSRRESYSSDKIEAELLPASIGRDDIVESAGHEDSSASKLHTLHRIKNTRSLPRTREQPRQRLLRIRLTPTQSNADVRCGRSVDLLQLENCVTNPCCSKERFERIRFVRGEECASATRSGQLNVVDEQKKKAYARVP